MARLYHGQLVILSHLCLFFVFFCFVFFVLFHFVFYFCWIIKHFVLFLFDLDCFFPILCLFVCLFVCWLVSFCSIFEFLFLFVPFNCFFYLFLIFLSFLLTLLTYTFIYSFIPPIHVQTVETWLSRTGCWGEVCRWTHAVWNRQVRISPWLNRSSYLLSDRAGGNTEPVKMGADSVCLGNTCTHNGAAPLTSLWRIA